MIGRSGSRRTLALLLAALLAALALGVTSAGAQKAPRVVALDWDALQNMVALGVTPVGAADLAGYDAWVSTRRPNGITDVGTRQEPSLSAIARLRPDVIVVPKWRATQNLSQLKRIARVVVTDPFAPGSARQRFQRSLSEFRTQAAAVGRRAQGERVIRTMNATFARERAALRRAGRGGAAVTLAQPHGTTSSPALRLFSTNSATTEAFRLLGLRNGWNRGTPPYGFTVQGLEALRTVQNTWLAFVYPHQYRAQVDAVRRQSAFTRLNNVRRGQVVTLNGRTWLYGGPPAWTFFATEMSARLRQR